MVDGNLKLYSISLNLFKNCKLAVFGERERVFALIKKCRRRTSTEPGFPFLLSLICLIEAHIENDSASWSKLFNVRVNLINSPSGCPPSRSKMNISPAGLYLIYETIFERLGYKVSFQKDTEKTAPEASTVMLTNWPNFRPIKIRVNQSLIEVPDEMVEFIRMLTNNVGMFWGYSTGSDCYSFLLVNLKSGAYRFVGTPLVYASDNHTLFLEASEMNYFRAFPCELVQSFSLYTLEADNFKLLVKAKQDFTDNSVSKFLVGFKIFQLGLIGNSKEVYRDLSCKPYRVTWRSESVNLWCRLKLTERMTVLGSVALIDFLISFRNIKSRPRISLRYGRVRVGDRKPFIFKVNRNVETESETTETSPSS